MPQNASVKGSGKVSLPNRPSDLKHRLSGIATALRELLTAVVSPGKSNEDSAETAEPIPEPPPGAAKAPALTRGSPWTLGRLGDCTFSERASEMNLLLAKLRSRSHTPYLRSSWIISHLDRWGGDALSGLDLEPPLQSVCSSAIKKIAGEIVDDIRKDPREGIVIWVHSPASQAGPDALGEPANGSIPFVSGMKVLNHLHRWVSRVIPECPTISRFDKLACGRVVMEAAWEIAETMREETRDCEKMIWIPGAETGELPEH